AYRHAAPPAHWPARRAIPGQAATRTSARQAANKLLRDARSAIKRADYSRAESLINHAEKLVVQYNPLTDRWSDTPDVLRKLLAQERAKATATKPGSKAPALLGGGNSSQAKPIPTHPTAGAAGSQQAVHTTVDQIT